MLTPRGLTNKLIFDLGNAFPDGKLDMLEQQCADPASLASIDVLRMLHAHIKRLSTQALDVRAEYASALDRERRHCERRLHRRSHLALGIARLERAREVGALQTALRDERAKCVELEARLGALRASS